MKHHDEKTLFNNPEENYFTKTDVLNILQDDQVRPCRVKESGFKSEWA